MRESDPKSWTVDMIGPLADSITSRTLDPLDVHRALIMGLDGVPDSKIAERIGASVSNIRSILDRARAQGAPIKRRAVKTLQQPIEQMAQDEADALDAAAQLVRALRPKFRAVDIARRVGRREHLDEAILRLIDKGLLDALCRGDSMSGNVRLRLTARGAAQCGVDLALYGAEQTADFLG